MQIRMSYIVASQSQTIRLPVIQRMTYSSCLSELRVRLVHRQTSFSPPVKYFTDRSKAMLLLWIIYVISALFCYAFMHVCLLIHCGHLLGKG